MGLVSPEAECTRSGRGPARGAPTSGDASSAVIPLGERPRGDDLSAPKVPPRDTPADAGDDLVVDRAARLGEVLRRLLRAGLRADERHVIALAGALDGGYVEHHQIHADAAGERHPLTAEQDPAAVPCHPGH